MTRFSWDLTSRAWPLLSQRAQTTNVATTSSLVSHNTDNKQTNNGTNKQTNTDNKCNADQFNRESGSVSQKFIGKMCESLTQINFVFKLVEAPLFRPFAGPTREHTVSLFFRENCVFMACTWIVSWFFWPFFAVYIDMGLSSNSPVVLTVVTSGQSFARSFSVKVRICICVCVCSCVRFVRSNGRKNTFEWPKVVSEVSFPRFWGYFLLESVFVFSFRWSEVPFPRYRNLRVFT